MQSSPKTDVILSQPAFRKLLSARHILRFSLSLLVIAGHAFFVGGIAFYRDFFAQPLLENGTITVGIASAMLVIVLFLVLEFIYIVITAKKIDPLQFKVMQEHLTSSKGEE